MLNIACGLSIRALLAVGGWADLSGAQKSLTASDGQHPYGSARSRRAVRHPDEPVAFRRDSQHLSESWSGSAVAAIRPFGFNFRCK